MTTEDTLHRLRVATKRTDLSPEDSTLIGDAYAEIARLLERVRHLKACFTPSSDDQRVDLRDRLMDLCERGAGLSDAESDLIGEAALAIIGFNQTLRGIRDSNLKLVVEKNRAIIGLRTALYQIAENEDEPYARDTARDALQTHSLNGGGA